MSQPPPSRQSILQNRIAAACVLVFCVVVATAIFMTLPKPTMDIGEEALAQHGVEDTRDVKTADDKGLYIGIRKPSPAEIRQSLPEIKDKPAVVMFHSQYCFDCKKMRPVLDKLMPEYTGIAFREFDILQDNKTSPAVFNTFKPVTVPVLIFIKPDGNIENVLYNYQNEASIRAALKALPGGTPVKQKPDKASS